MIFKPSSKVRIRNCNYIKTTLGSIGTIIKYSIQIALTAYLLVLYLNNYKTSQISDSSKRSYFDTCVTVLIAYPKKFKTKVILLTEENLYYSSDSRFYFDCRGKFYSLRKQINDEDLEYYCHDFDGFDDLTTNFYLATNEKLNSKLNQNFYNSTGYRIDNITNEEINNMYGYFGISTDHYDMETEETADQLIVEKWNKTNNYLELRLEKINYFVESSYFFNDFKKFVSYYFLPPTFHNAGKLI